MGCKQVFKALDILKKNGFKTTKKREEILRYLFEADRYTSAKEVYQHMNKLYTGISYDTIYRNLNDFSIHGVIEETELNGEKKFRFHCSHDNHEHHHHFICTNCGSTKEINMCPMGYFEDQLADCKITGHRFEIFGLCANCQ
ncbi:transcriptional repressor [Vagococcus coleopterorum]|uniref:Transcriptional repressor n=1 Tax=Vagococcus coleopterorum TaxID=2714946 RepID=A0A6G8APJ8_9ENTE|nr:transcriptional repressor [Vagococcus coleopterorum]QIL46900.1 transcriptional repressor [Vagococcus coleopterorum]